jgi:hypothetical protein
MRPESVYGRNLSADEMRSRVRQQIDLEVAYQRDVVEQKINLQKREMIHELSEFVRERNKEREERMRQVRICISVGAMVLGFFDHFYNSNNHTGTSDRSDRRAEEAKRGGRGGRSLAAGSSAC